MHPVPKTVLNTAPSQDPISLASLKTFLRIDGSSEDTLLTSILRAATKRLEKLTGKKFVDQTWDIYFDYFPGKAKDVWWDGTREGAISELYSPCGIIELPFGTLKSVSGFYTYDNDGTEYEFASSNYVIDNIGSKGKIALKNSTTWPATVLRPLNGIKITAVFGYGDGYIEDPETASEVPEDIQEAIKQLAAVMYEHRGDEMSKIPKTVTTLLEPYMEYKVR